MDTGDPVIRFRWACAAILCWPVLVSGCAASRGPGAWGPESATPGMRLVLEEKARRPSASGTEVLYAVKVTGAPGDRTCRLWTRARGAAPVMVRGGYVDQSGVFVNGQTGEETQFVAVGLAPGERYEIGAVTTDDSGRAFARVVPFVLEARGAGRCRIWAEMDSPRADAFMIRGEGFGSREETNATLQSGDDIHLDNFVITDEGTFQRLVFPVAYFKRPEGTGAYTVAGKDCKMTLNFSWGPRALRPE